MMRNYLTFGPIRLLVSRRHLAPWGYEILGVWGLSFLSRTNDGDLILASYQPKGETWHWSVCLARRKADRGWIQRDSQRHGQWHDYYRLPLVNREIIVSQQDWHLLAERRAA
jgi:hypothetical protein